MRNITLLNRVHGAFRRTVIVAVLNTAWGLVFYVAPARASIISMDASALAPEMREKVTAALLKLKESPDDISAVETLLEVEPRVVETIGTNQVFGGSDPVRSEALKWSQRLQPAEVLAACLEQGSNAAVQWALRQIVWRRSSGGFDPESMVRLVPGIENALGKSAPATRAQAVRTLMTCLASERRAPFLRGLLKEKDQPDEVTAAVIEGFANDLRQSDPDVEVMVTNGLKTSESPLLLNACCTYWWLVKSRSPSAVKDGDILPFERLAGHADATVRSSVARAVSEVATPGRPRAIALLLRLTSDKDWLVGAAAGRSLRHANTPEVNARLREILAADQTENLRAAAIEVLGAFGKENLPLIVKAAQADKQPLVRQFAVYALRTIGTPEAGAALEVASQDPHETVRREAQEQLECFRREHPAGK